MKPGPRRLLDETPGPCLRTRARAFSYREGGKIKHKTIANVSDLPPESLEVLRRSLKDEKLVAANDAFKIRSSRSHGAVHAVLSIIRKTDFDSTILSYDKPWRRTALAMIIARILKPKSKLFTSGWWQLGYQTAP